MNKPEGRTQLYEIWRTTLVEAFRDNDAELTQKAQDELRKLLAMDGFVRGCSVDRKPYERDTKPRNKLSAQDKINIRIMAKQRDAEGRPLYGFKYMASLFGVSAWWIGHIARDKRKHLKKPAPYCRKKTIQDATSQV